VTVTDHSVLTGPPSPVGELKEKGRDGRWTPDPGFGIYVHIPFCRHRCHYCDFNTYEGQDAIHADYVNALINEIDRYDGSHPNATSIFFGGGTPTLLAAGELRRVLEAIERRFGFAPEAEVTVEANPETLGFEYCSALLEAGFNRISIGVQSTAAHVLQGLGRTHDAARALDAISCAREAGFTDINADLIYGSPWETLEDWRTSLDRVLAFGPDHISAYALTVEEGTPLATFVTTGRIEDVDPDVQAERHAVAEDVLARAGFERYEISNWARPGRASRHNLLYWCAGDYIGFGAGAHSHVEGRRWWTLRLPRDFIAAVAVGRSTIDGAEHLDAQSRAGEALMLGLRLKSGIELDTFVTRFGPQPLERRLPVLREFEGAGFLKRDANWLSLTERGTMLANELMWRLL
jgi:putative oxygen-independent coproporphyrinogen III oxidase